MKPTAAVVVPAANPPEQEIGSLLEGCFLQKSTRQNREKLSKTLTDVHIDQLMENIRQHSLEKSNKMDELRRAILFSANKSKEETKNYYNLALALYAIQKLLESPADQACQCFFNKTCKALDPLFTGKDALQIAMIALAEAVIGAGFIIAGAPIVPVAATLGAVVGLSLLAKAVHCIFFKKPSELSKDMLALKNEIDTSVVGTKL